MNIIQRFQANERGAVMVMFATMIIPLMILAGLAVDVSQAYLIKSRLSHALDAAALAVGSMRSISSDTTYLESKFADFVKANYADTDVGATHDLTFSDVGGIISVTGKASVSTVFLNIIGVNSITVSSSAEIIVETNGLELVMVLDNTGSMGGSNKMADMKTAAHELIDIIFGNETAPDLLKVGLVPFDNTVNIGTAMTAYVSDPTAVGFASLEIEPAPINVARHQSLRWGYVNVPQTLRLNTASSLGVGTQYGQWWWGGGGSSSSATWEGCVMARDYPADTQDTSVGVDGLWTPFYNIKSSDRNKYCPRPITALTNNRSTLDSEIDAMSALGSTHINLGAAWGWRVLSPDAPFSEGAAYGDADWNKVAIILTDGDNRMIDSYYSAYGVIADGNLNTTSSSTVAQAELDSRLIQVCDGMKNEGIVVYTIAFGTSIASTTASMLSDCASSTGHYFESPDAATLSLAFRAIGAELKNLHISK